MTLASLMVPLDLGPCSSDRLQLACNLAERFDAHLIGVAAREALPHRLYGRGSYLNREAVDAAAARLEQELSQVEAEFRRVSSRRQRVEWRVAREDPMTFLTRQARAADLVILSRYSEEATEDWCSCIEPGEAILQLGRPVLIVPPRISTLAVRRVVVAWKDTREARRTLLDAMPFLKAADQVLVVEVAGEGATSDVSGYLAHHGVPCTLVRKPAATTGIAAEILRVVQTEGADLIVAGAYGHTRLRERIFGSVTRNLLERTPVCCFMSH